MNAQTSVMPLIIKNSHILLKSFKKNVKTHFFKTNDDTSVIWNQPCVRTYSKSSFLSHCNNSVSGLIIVAFPHFSMQVTGSCSGVSRIAARGCEKSRRSELGKNSCWFFNRPGPHESRMWKLTPALSLHFLRVLIVCVFVCMTVNFSLCLSCWLHSVCACLCVSVKPSGKQNTRGSYNT